MLLYSMVSMNIINIAVFVATIAAIIMIVLGIS